jgi:hypothetical protein
MPHLKTWRRLLADERGEQPAAALAAEMQARYDALIADAPRTLDRSLRAQLAGRILPGLALYQVLRATGMDGAAALAEMEPLFRAAFFARMQQGLRWFAHLPAPFPVVRLVLRWMVRSPYRPDAQEIIEDSADCFAVNVYRCFILDTLTAHGAPELTALYCQTDDWLAEALPQVKWLRTRTLGRGDELCDFRWRR